MPEATAQPLIRDASGDLRIEGDWYPFPLPPNLVLGEMSYPDTAYSFSSFFSTREEGFRLGYASGNYGHGIFTAGPHGRITVGNFVVLQCTRIISNAAVTIGDHCMFSWGSVITDSWVTAATASAEIRRKMLECAAHAPHRHLEFTHPLPVVIGDNVWVGFDAVILPGVNIGRGAVIGCKTIVKEDVPAYAVVVGNPARIIRYLDADDTEETRLQAIHDFIPIASEPHE